MIQGRAPASATCRRTSGDSDLTKRQSPAQRSTPQIGTKLNFDVAADNRRTDNIALKTAGGSAASKRSPRQKATMAAAMAKSPIACAPAVTCQTAEQVPTHKLATQIAVHG